MGLAATFTVLTREEVARWVSGPGSTFGARLHLAERLINAQVERATTGYASIAGGSGSGYGSSVSHAMWIGLTDAPASAVRCWIANANLDGSVVQGTGIYARLVYVGGSGLVDLTGYKLLSTSALLTALTLTTTVIPADAMVALDVNVPNGQTFSGQGFVEWIKTGIPA